MKRKRKSHQYSLRDAAKLIGVAPITLRRWLLSGKVAEVARDRNGWRVFSGREVVRLRKFARQIKPPAHK
jgi:DNA (cytosine-5)-methyltransferase 1